MNSNTKSSSIFKNFYLNGEIRPIDEAVVSLNNIEYCYGYGVYETLKVRKSRLFFIDYHVKRILESANIIGIDHKFSEAFIKESILSLVKKTKVDSYNLKLLLIGGAQPIFAALPLAPLFPDKKLYKKGTNIIVEQYERKFPTAKSLNMLGSYIAYKKAKKMGCYDALLIDKNKIVLEGTRTNICFIKDKNIYHAPYSRILQGVTLTTLKPVAEKIGYSFIEKEFSIDEIKDFDDGFLTSTSSKIIPIRKIGDFIFPEICDSIKELISNYNQFLKEYSEK